MRILTLLVAAAALILSIGNLLWSRRGGQPATSALEAHSPRPPAASAVDCQVGEVTTVRALMRHGVNPRLTSLSFALHHDPRPQPERLGAIADHAQQMLGCLERLRVVANDVTIDSLPDYYRHLGDLQQSVLALRLSAMEGDEGATHHWFDHMKQECNGCHSRFRVLTDSDEAAAK